MADPTPGNEPVRVRRRGGVLDALHVILGVFPIAYFLLAFLIDITYVRSGGYYIWPFFSIWLITAALVAGGLAVLIGIIDWFATRSTRRHGTSWHGILTIVALVLGLFNAFIHSRDGWGSVVPEGIILSGVSTLLLIIAAVLGAASSRRTA